MGIGNLLLGKLMSEMSHPSTSMAWKLGLIIQDQFPLSAYVSCQLFHFVDELLDMRPYDGFI